LCDPLFSPRPSQTATDFYNDPQNTLFLYLSTGTLPSPEVAYPRPHAPAHMHRLGFEELFFFSYFLTTLTSRVLVPPTPHRNPRENSVRAPISAGQRANVFSFAAFSQSSEPHQVRPCPPPPSRPSLPSPPVPRPHLFTLPLAFPYPHSPSL